MVAICYDSIRVCRWVRVLTTILSVIMTVNLTPYMTNVTEIILGSQRKLQSVTLTPILNHAIRTWLLTPLLCL